MDFGRQDDVVLAGLPLVGFSATPVSAATTFDHICQSIGLAADSVTFILGTLALWALVFHRRKIGLVIRVLLSSFLNERVKRTKETLGKLESLNYDNKDDRAELIALLGQVSGQIKPFAVANSDLAAINNEVRDILDKKIRLNEATKRRLTYEMHAALDAVSYSETRAILEAKE